MLVVSHLSVTAIFYYLFASFGDIRRPLWTLPPYYREKSGDVNMNRMDFAVFLRKGVIGGYKGVMVSACGNVCMLLYPLGYVPGPDPADWTPSGIFLVQSEWMVVIP